MEKKELTIVKVGTGVLSNANRTALDHEAMVKLGADIATIEGHSVGRTASRLDHEGSVVLVSSGAVTAGKEKLGLPATAFSDTRIQQMAAMVGNTVLFGLWERYTGIITGHDLPTHNDLELQEHWDNLVGVVATNLAYGVLSGFNDGDARSTEELEMNLLATGQDFKRFGDNDQLTALFGVQLGAFAKDFGGRSARVIFLTDTDGVREDVTHPDSRIDYLSATDLSYIIEHCVSTEGVSNGGMLSKLEAAQRLVNAGVAVSIGAGKAEGCHSLLDLYNHVPGVGTHISA